MRFFKNCLPIIILVVLTVPLSGTVCYAPQKDYIQMLFVGDLMFDRDIRRFAQQNNSNEFIFEKISPILLSNDLVVANLEGPITSAKSMSINPNATVAESITFTFDPSLAKTLFNQNIRIVNLGNNHILNFGKNGIDQTEKYLKEAGVEYFGVPEAKEGLIKDIGGIKIGFVSYNYYEFRGDLEKAERATLDRIIKIKGSKGYPADIIIVFCHWGDEYKLDHNKNQEILARKFIDQGADLIIGGHPHVIQDQEEYKGNPPSPGASARQGKIYYSLGNFIFDQYFSENVKTGMGVVAKIDKQTKEMYFSQLKFYTQTTGQTIVK